MIVGWTPGALADIREIREYIARDSEQSAQRVVQRIFDSTVRLAQFPQSASELTRSRGRVIRNLVDPPYQLLYEVQDRVLILAVVHSRRNLKQILERLAERP